MGVGPARFGLKPGAGRKPGHNPLYDQVTPRHTIHYPGTTPDRYPSRSLIIFVNVRRAIFPSTTLYPGTGLYTGGARQRVADSILSGAGRFSTFVSRHFKRTSTLVGAGFLSSSPLASSVPRTTLSGIVELSDVDLVVDLSSVEEVVDLAVIDSAVEL